MEVGSSTCARALELSPANGERRTCMANQPAYGDVVVRLEAAALAIGQLDTVLSGHPLLPAWRFWSQLDTARRHAEADGRRVDLYRLAAFLHGLPLRVAAPCPWTSGAAT